MKQFKIKVRVKDWKVGVVRWGQQGNMFASQKSLTFGSPSPYNGPDTEQLRGLLLQREYLNKNK